MNKKGGVKMGILYDNFKELKKQAPKDWFMDKMGIVKFELNSKNYEIFFLGKEQTNILLFTAKTIR